MKKLIQKVTSEKVKISNAGSGIEHALTVAEQTAGFMKINAKERLRMRLLAEEMFSMVQTIAGNFSADFWMEAEERSCTLHLDAKSELDYPKQQELISVSTSGKNSAKLGIMDKIRAMIEAGLYGIEESFALQAEYGTGFMPYGAIGVPDDGMSDALYAWSMSQYKHDVEAEKDEDPDSYDELEKSIIANVADDVKVGISKGRIEIEITKKF